MAASKTKRVRSYARVASGLLLLSFAVLFLTLLLLGTAGRASASQLHATNRQRQGIPLQPADTPSVGTDTPIVSTPTDVPPTDTPADVPPTATSADTGVATSTPVASNTPADTGNGGNSNAGTGASGPLPTRVALSQPTAIGGPASTQGGSSSGFGSNGLLIATLLGCVIAVLGISIGAFALNALVRSGYGPFLRALLQGERRTGGKDQRDSRDGTRRARRPTGVARPSFEDDSASHSGYDDHRSRGDYSGEPLSRHRGPRQRRSDEYSGRSRS